MFRAYSPDLGRWLNRDPIGERGGLNRYGYAQNSPVNMIDPLGLDALDDFLQSAADASAGFGDTITSVPFTGWSLTGSIRGGLGLDTVNYCSWSYTGGEVAGLAWTVAAGGAGGARAGARSAPGLGMTRPNRDGIGSCVPGGRSRIR